MEGEKIFGFIGSEMELG